jgi:hypothetical protein
MHAHPCLSLDPSLFQPGNGLSPVRAGLVWGFDLPAVTQTLAMPEWLAELVAAVSAAGEDWIPALRKTAVRTMLRYGKYRASGRGKPSSEYLLAAALAGEFPLVNGPVDVNNAVSLRSGYPASIFDLEKTGTTLRLGRGVAGESYVFNPSGQSIDLEDLVCVQHPDPAGEIWLSCGNPVKDAMATKIFPGARQVVAVIYAPRPEAESPAPLRSAPFRSKPGRLETAGRPGGEDAVPIEVKGSQETVAGSGVPVDPLAAACEDFVRLLRLHCGAAEAGWSIVG